MLGLRVGWIACLSLCWLATGCKSDETGGGTDTEASTGSDPSSAHGDASLDDDGSPSSFTSSPDDGGDDGADDGVGETGPADSTGPSPGTGGSDGSGGSGGTGSTGTAGSDEGSATEGGDGGRGGECCMEQNAGGCGGGPVERCVCAEDDFCCTTAWDEVCTVQVVILGCGTCPGIGGDGDCCAANGTPGCDDDAVESCVCAQDIVCCTQDWDQLCVDAVEGSSCGQCP